MNFDKELLLADNLIPKKSQEINYARKNIELVNKYIQKLSETYDIRTDDFRCIINEELVDNLLDYVKLGATGLLQKQNAAFNELVNNPHILKNMYQSIKDQDVSNLDMEKEKVRYYGNREECMTLAIEESLHTIRESKNLISPEVFELVEKMNKEKRPEVKKKVKQLLEKEPDIKKDIELIDCFSGDNEEEKLTKYVKSRQNIIRERIEFIKKENIKISGKFLGKFGFLEEELMLQNRDYQALGLDNLQYNMEKQEEGDVGLKDIFTDEYLEVLTNEQLTILNTFWQNRYTKDLEKIMEGLFIFDTLHYWDKLKNGEKIEQLSDNEVLNLLYKNKICARGYKKLVQDGIKKGVKSEGDMVYTLLSLNDIDEKFSNEYKKYFDYYIAGSNNNYKEDLNSIATFRNQMANIYKEKDEMLKEALLDVQYSRAIPNWGYIPENKDGKNSIKRSNKFILIGIDYPGFNMPLRVHFSREELLKYMKKIKQSTILPVYEGVDDMTYNGKNITTKILMPLTEKGESEIIKQNKTIVVSDLKYKYITHLGNLVTKKVKRMKKIIPSKFVDIETGDEGLVMDGKIVTDEGR